MQFWKIFVSIDKKHIGKNNEKKESIRELLWQVYGKVMSASHEQATVFTVDSQKRVNLFSPILWRQNGSVLPKVVPCPNSTVTLCIISSAVTPRTFAEMHSRICLPRYTASAV